VRRLAKIEMKGLGISVYPSSFFTLILFLPTFYYEGMMKACLKVAELSHAFSAVKNFSALA
jgi:hypothetical protein